MTRQVFINLYPAGPGPVWQSEEDARLVGDGATGLVRIDYEGDVPVAVALLDEENTPA